MNKDKEFNDWLCEREDGIGYSSFDKKETADEIFEKLGYEKKEEKFKNEIEKIEYRKTIKDDIYEEVVKIIELNNPKIYEFPIINLTKILKNIYRESNVDLSLQELQAIIKKIVELRWIKKQ